MRVVVPFRTGGKSRLPADLREEIALAMLGDVLEVAADFGETHLVTDDPAARLIGSELGVEAIDDPGGGQSAAVEAGLAGAEDVCLVVNADLPLLRRADLADLAVPALNGRFAVAAATDGTTNALGLPQGSVFAPVYGPASAGRFRARAAALGIAIEDVHTAGLVADVDTIDDLARLGPSGGPRTSALVAGLALGSPGPEPRA